MLVQARKGVRIANSTRDRLEEMGATFLYSPTSRHPWSGYLNKPYALAAAEERVSTSLTGWLDSDVLVVQQPDGLNLKSDVDFAACAPDKNIGSIGQDDPNDAYWKAACDAVGLSINSLPWIVTETCKRRIRLYWNSGVFVFRNGKNFPERYLRTCEKLMEQRIGQNTGRFFFTDQIALGLAMVASRLRWQALPYAYNRTLLDDVDGSHGYSPLREAKIIHYHDWFTKRHWPTALAALECLPPVRDWLEVVGPTSSNLSLVRTMAVNVVQIGRKLQKIIFESNSDTEYH